MASLTVLLMKHFRMWLESVGMVLNPVGFSLLSWRPLEIYPGVFIMEKFVINARFLLKTMAS